MCFAILAVQQEELWILHSKKFLPLRMKSKGKLAIFPHRLTKIFVICLKLWDIAVDFHIYIFKFLQTEFFFFEKC